MDVNSVTTSAVNALATQRSGDAIGISVLKLALRAQSQGALALIEALPPVPTSNLPPHLGNNVNTTA